jgi:hypothetical protein
MVSEEGCGRKWLLPVLILSYYSSGGSKGKTKKKITPVRVVAP